MTQIEDSIYQLIKEYVIEAGKIMMHYRGKVVDEGKEVQDLGYLVDEFKADRMSKTIVDEIIQELFLAKLFRSHPDVRINVEERTPLRNLFAGNTSSCTVHQDSCDGTKSYVDGHDEFATGYGISNGNNEFTHTVIFSPVRKKIYVASPNERQILDDTLKPLSVNIPQNHKRVFEKRMLSEKGKRIMVDMGFTIEKPRSSHIGIVDVATGEAGAFLYVNSNPHDSLIPYSFAKGLGATMLNASGKEITSKDVIVKQNKGFQEFEKLKTVCYFAPRNNHAETIMDVLSDDTNLHPDYLKIR